MLVTYVFGPRLPTHGRCISNIRDLQQLNRRPEQYPAYVVEVCPSLLVAPPAAGPADRRPAGPAPVRHGLIRRAPRVGLLRRSAAPRGDGQPSSSTRSCG